MLGRAQCVRLCAAVSFRSVHYLIVRLLEPNLGTIGGLRALAEETFA